MTLEHKTLTQWTQTRTTGVTTIVLLVLRTGDLKTGTEKTEIKPFEQGQKKTVWVGKAQTNNVLI